MLTTILAAGGAAAAQGDNPYGLQQALKEGGLISQTVFAILVLMSIVSFYILFSKLFEQQKIMNAYKKVGDAFWKAPSMTGCPLGYDLKFRREILSSMIRLARALESISLTGRLVPVRTSIDL